jgi:queuine tRNA-ribosyltransferase
MFDFSITAQDGKARVGEFTTPHGTIETPVFMPVGTHGAVKGVSPFELAQIGSQIILANTYHLYLRPTDTRVAALGGLHALMGWDKPILTDSGGFQVFSLGERGMDGRQKASLRTVSEEGIVFQSHLDGSRHSITPEKSIQIQQNLGADIIMAFDQPVYGLTSVLEAEEAMERTKRWLVRSKQQWQGGDIEKQALFGIVQGGIHTELHRRSAHYTVEQNLPGNAIGGLSVGEGKREMWAAVESINAILPLEKPRYFMGLGDPKDLIDAVLRGVDIFDCVAPTRLARHGVVWLVEGDTPDVEAFWTGKGIMKEKSLSIKRINLHNAKYKDITEPLNPFLPNGLSRFSYGALNHYIREGEMLGYRILSLHNIAVLHQIVESLKGAIRQGKAQEVEKIFTYQ